MSDKVLYEALNELLYTIVQVRLRAGDDLMARSLAASQEHERIFFAMCRLDRQRAEALAAAPHAWPRFTDAEPGALKFCRDCGVDSQDPLADWPCSRNELLARQRRHVEGLDQFQASLVDKIAEYEKVLTPEQLAMLQSRAMQ